MACCNHQLMLMYSIEVIVPGIISCQEPLYTCKQFSWPRYSRDDQVIIPQKVVEFHNAAGFTPERMVKFSTMITLIFPEPSPRYHTDQFQKGVDHHEAAGALPNAIIPTSTSFPEPTSRHRCNRFPCPLDHPGRSSAPAMSTAEVDHDEISKHHVISEGMQNSCPEYEIVRLGQLQTGVLDNSSASGGVLMIFNPIIEPVRTIPDGGHRCTEFPCPKCHGDQYQNAVDGVQRISANGPGLPNPLPAEVMINCNRFPCPYGQPGRSSAPAMSTAELDHDEIFKHRVISERIQNPCPEYQEVRLGQFQYEVLDNSRASAGVPMIVNPIVDPMRTFPDKGHQCTTFPCPKCHGDKFQNGAQRICAIESGLPDPAPGETMISFPKPTIHRCNQFPCPLCQPGHSAAAIMSRDHQEHDLEIKHVKISKRVDQSMPQVPAGFTTQGVPIHPIPMTTLVHQVSMSNLSQKSSESFTALSDLPIPNSCKTQVIAII